MHDLAARQQRGQRRGQGLVDAASASTAAEDQQHRLLLAEAQPLASHCLLAGQSQNLGPNRVAGHHGLAGKIPGNLRKGHADLTSKAAHALDRQARLDVGQVDEHRQAGA